MGKSVSAKEIDPALILDEELMRRLFSSFIVDQKTKCWLWTASLKRGYGSIEWRGSTWKAHRLTWVCRNGGDIPPGLEPDHLCITRRCVYPEHMELVPSEVNVLRSRGVTAHNAVKTTCVAGHSLELENITPNRLKRGERECRQCKQRRAAERRELIRSACHVMGVSRSDYISMYGDSVAPARAVLSDDTVLG